MSLLAEPGNTPAASALAPVRKRGRQEEPEHRSIRLKIRAGPVSATGWHQEGVDIELQKNLELLLRCSKLIPSPSWSGHSGLLSQLPLRNLEATTLYLSLGEKDRKDDQPSQVSRHPQESLSLESHHLYRQGPDPQTLETWRVPVLSWIS